MAWRRSAPRSAPEGGRLPEPLLLGRARARLGASASPLAHEALASGALYRAPGGTRWEATSGTMRGVRLVLVVPPSLHASLEGSPSSEDELTHAVSMAVGESAGEVLADLVVEAGPSGDGAGPPGHGGGPYRTA